MLTLVLGHEPTWLSLKSRRGHDLALPHEGVWHVELALKATMFPYYILQGIFK